MNKLIPTILLTIILAACTAAPTPVVESTATPLPPTATAFVLPSATVELRLPPATAPAVTELVPTPTASNLRTSPIDGMPQVYIPAGTFRMGGMDARSAPDERPAHYVTLDAYWMDQLEVTNAMYILCLQSGSCTPPQSLKSAHRLEYFNNPEFKDYPVIYVTWAQARTYCEWAGGHLPTEAQWERAARGDDWRTFPWGEDKADDLRANFNMLVGDTSRVGTYPLGASPFGILDMAGNVAEWTNDYYSGTYYNSQADAVNPTGPASSASLKRVVRGGSLGDAEINIRVAKRSAVAGSNVDIVPVTPGDFSPRIGFRCAQDK
ncbi:MAG: formylglycine-generating enzyme family protein [Bacteroidota bacterium]